ncbi:unnamed protein product [Ambrosiozyma monospora]|uniref:Unnamed protein product n=1 Tax=Ambrosiozyma monospora TaxID=43982 RepID=A0ACB5TXD1_AMBMO|nr:unnamed protein product [Ambrosiozyma monospora]
MKASMPNSINHITTSSDLITYNLSITSSHQSISSHMDKLRCDTLLLFSSSSIQQPATAPHSSTFDQFDDFLASIPVS